jgi:hypothetical protein
MKIGMQQKIGDVDMDDLRMKLNGVKQKLRYQVQLYFERLDDLFRKGKIKDVEQRHKFLAHLQLRIKKLCTVKTYANVKEMLSVAKEVERVYGEFAETPFEPFMMNQC